MYLYDVSTYVELLMWTKITKICKKLNDAFLNYAARNSCLAEHKKQRYKVLYSVLKLIFKVLCFVTANKIGKIKRIVSNVI